MSKGPVPSSPGSDGSRHWAGSAWLVIDMTLVTGVFVLVRMEGGDRSAIQLVFLRALVGLLLIAPLVVRYRAEFRHMRQPWRNAGRVACNALALTFSFSAISLMPLATVNAIGFTRPLVSMALAAVLLGERVRRLQWVGAAVALVGVTLLATPGASGFGPLPPSGLAAAGLSVLFGAVATLQTRVLRGESTIVMMTFYNAGLTLLAAIPAAITWRPVTFSDLLPLVAIGALAQAGQFCFLRAYRTTEARFLAPISYLSILLTAGAGFILFSERPAAGFWAGGIVVLTGVWLVLHSGRH